MAAATQDYKSHRQFVPMFHFFVLPILLGNVAVEIARLNKYQTLYHVWVALVAVALFLFAFAARGMALRAQDRIIRFEERQRLSSLLPAEHHAKIDNLTPGQLVALRFAPDEEAPGLAQRTMSGELKTPNDIKKAVKNWRGDYHRV